MDLGLKGRVALVAASSRGLGKACALALAREGAFVSICARGAASLAAAATQISATTGAELLPVQADLTDPAQIQRLVDATVERFGRIDVLVTNNGGPPAGRFDGFQDQAWLAAHELTLMSAVRLVRAVLPGMRDRRWGRIVNITSVTVKQPIDNLLLSNVYRLGVVGLAKTLAAEVARDGVTINNVAPGHMRTDRVLQLAQIQAAEQGHSRDDSLAAFAASYPIGRLGEPEELAALVVFLASERASFITGTTIPVDGGYVRGVM
jgi:3-oxoacyl-[acyl-carrier protein] reductase